MFLPLSHTLLILIVVALWYGGERAAAKAKVATDPLVNLNFMVKRNEFIYRRDKGIAQRILNFKGYLVHASLFNSLDGSQLVCGFKKDIIYE